MVRVIRVIVSVILISGLWIGCNENTEIQGVNRLSEDYLFSRITIPLNRYIDAKQRRIIENYITRNNLGAKRTENGYYEVYLKKGAGVEITENKNIVITGKILSLDGRVLYEYDVDRPLIFRLNTSNDFVGLHIALANKRVGDELILIFPPELAYGRLGDNDQIDQDAIVTAIFSVQKSL